MKTISVCVFGVCMMAIFASIVGYNASLTQAGGSMCSDVIYGIASWYSSHECYGKTASGEDLDDDELTAAIWNMPFNAILEVKNIHNGKKVNVRVNDRGPNKRLVKRGRVIDLSKKAFSLIEDIDSGLCNVSIRRIK